MYPFQKRILKKHINKWIMSDPSTPPHISEADNTQNQKAKKNHA